MRGSPHSHGLYWVENTPEFIEDDEPSEFKCCEFIDDYATCKRVDDGLLGKYVAYQIHKHSHTCRKNQNEDNCRFQFERKSKCDGESLYKPKINSVLHVRRPVKDKSLHYSSNPIIPVP